MAKVVLVAEDDDETREVIAEMLRDEGYTVEVASGPGTVAEVQSHRPDVVILDFEMPNMDGIAVAQYIRAHPDLQHVPIVALTAQGRVAEVCREMGASGCLGKPFEIEDLLAMVRDPYHGSHTAG